MATYYVDGAVGNDANAGTSEGSGNAWATVAKGVLGRTAGDIVYVKSSAVYDETPVVNTNGTNSSPVVVKGYNSTPGDGGQFTLRNSSGKFYGVLCSGGGTYWQWWNMVIEDYASYGFYAPSADSVSLINVSIDNCNNGVVGDDRFALVGCEVSNCSNTGIQIDQYSKLIDCRFIENGINYNVWLRDNYAYVSNCVFVGVSSNLACLYTNMLPIVTNCTFDGQGVTNGFRFSNAFYTGVLTNNVFYDCVVGLDDNGLVYPAGNVGGHNLFYSNTTDYDTAAWVDAYRVGDITGVDPGFASPGTFDYSIDSTSPCFEAGYPSPTHIGAVYPACAPGGGRVVLTT